jgi:beta-phosphoglucomutase-like phosphatase (HAD superfamily)
MIKGIIFDLEGTLVDTWKIYWEVFNETAIKLNLPRAPKQEFLTLLDQGCSLEETFC